MSRDGVTEVRRDVTVTFLHLVLEPRPCYRYLRQFQHFYLPTHDQTSKKLVLNYSMINNGIDY